jgi:hypothetical protein
MNSNRLSYILNRIFHIIFLISFGTIFINILFNGYIDENKGYNELTRLQIVLVFILIALVFAAAYIFFVKLKPNRLSNTRKSDYDISDKKTKIIIFSVVGLMLVIQLIVAYWLEMVPVSDLNNVNGFALDFGYNGNFDLIQKEYYANSGYVSLIRYPNNLGIYFLLSIIYRIFYLIFGYIPNYLPVCVNTVFINISVLMTVMIARKLFGNRKAIFVLVFCVLFMPYYTYTSYYYTDSLSMPFFMGALYLFICGVNCNKKYKKYVFVAISGVLIFAGYKIKGSVIIFLAVAIVYLILKFDFKRMICLALALVIGFGSVWTAYSVTFKKLNIITDEQFEEYQFPASHWVMMGLKGLGDYNAEDRDFTLSFPTKEEKQEADVEVIKERLEDYGVAGLNDHLIEKATWTWEDGTYFISHHIEKAVRENLLHSFVLDAGENHLVFYIYSCAFQLFLIFMICLSILKGCIKPKIDITTLFKGIVFSAFLFFLIWETRSRYLYNFTPVFILLTVDGLDFITGFVKSKNKPKHLKA